MVHHKTCTAWVKYLCNSNTQAKKQKRACNTFTEENILKRSSLILLGRLTAAPTVSLNQTVINLSNTQFYLHYGAYV